MAKVKGPLQSIRAKGRIAGVLDFRDYPAGPMHETRVYIQTKHKKKPTGAAQAKKEIAIRVSALWRTLTQAEKESWGAFAFDYRRYGAEYVWRPELSEYHKFMSFNLQRLAVGLEPLRLFAPLDPAMFPAVAASLDSLWIPTISLSEIFFDVPEPEVFSFVPIGLELLLNGERVYFKEPEGSGPSFPLNLSAVVSPDALFRVGQLESIPIAALSVSVSF